MTVTVKVNEFIARSNDLCAAVTAVFSRIHVVACKTTQRLDHPIIKLRSTPWAVCTEQKKT